VFDKGNFDTCTCNLTIAQELCAAYASDVAFVNHSHPVTKLLCLVHVVRGHEDLAVLLGLL